MVPDGAAGAMRVKLADNLGNSDALRPAIPGGEERRRVCYAPVRAMLRAGPGMAWRG